MSGVYSYSTFRRLFLKLSAVIIYIAFSSLSFMPLTHAAPNGGNIVGGSGSINSAGLTTTINQTTSSMVINWDSYDLSSSETVNYLQPSSTAISLNRIIGGDASAIHGQINADGHVVLVNPNGLFFGKNAT
ncbi:MAG: filamentous hemagglutinin N-terminal domain-containing protein, partial [Gammaproteobacteria bacterium]|nr:filamentous hemagglutinin N-terminal domain-containing protein [Gammaproteobacteria bacterium]